MLKLIIVFFIFLYSADSSDERNFNTRWHRPEDYCESFITSMNKDDFQIVDVKLEDYNKLYIYLADYKLVNRYLRNQLDDAIIAITEYP